MTVRVNIVEQFEVMRSRGFVQTIYRPARHTGALIQAPIGVVQTHNVTLFLASDGSAITVSEAAAATSAVEANVAPIGINVVIGRGGYW